MTFILELCFRYLDDEIMYVTVCNVGPFIEKVNLDVLNIKTPKTMLYHIVGVSSKHKIK